MSRRGTTLIEAVVVVVVLALAVPPVLSFASRAADTRAEAITVTRANMLASIVMEQILADSVTIDVGGSANYVDQAGTGLRARLASQTSAYAALGLEYAVQFSGPVGPALTASAVSAENIYRTVSVVVTYQNLAGESRTLTLSGVVGRP